MAARDVLVITVIIFTFGIAFLSGHFMLNQAYDRLLNNTIINESQSTVTVLEAGKELTNRFDYIVFAIFIILCISLIITGWFVGGHPIFMFVYFIVIVIATILGAIFANAWELVSTNTIFISTLTSFPLTNHIISALPIYAAVIGFIGIVVMFAKPFIGNQE